MRLGETGMSLIRKLAAVLVDVFYVIRAQVWYLVFLASSAVLFSYALEVHVLPWVIRRAHG